MKEISETNTRWDADEKLTSCENFLENIKIQIAMMKLRE